MGVKVINRAYRNQFYPTSQETDWLLGNVGDWQQLRVTFEVTIDFKASTQETVSIDVPEKTIKLNNGKTWSFYGFDIGDVVKFTYKRDVLDGNGNTDTTSYIANLTITNLYGDTMEHDTLFTVDHLQSIGVIPTDRGNEKIYNVKFESTKEPEGLKFRYSHLTNDNYQSDNLNSFIDGSVAEFSFAGLNNLITNVPIEMNPDGIQSGMAIDKCWVIKHVPNSGVYSYTVVCNFMIASFFEQVSNLEEMIAPSILFNAGSLTDNFELVVYPEWNNPNTVIRNNLDHTERLGNTGWFNENFNGLDNNFTIDSIAYYDESGNPLSQLDYANPVNVEIEVSGINNLSLNSEFNIGFAWIPQDEDDYHNKMTPFHQNLLVNTGKERTYTLNDGGSFNLSENTGSTNYSGYSYGEPKIDLQASENILFNSAGSNKIILKAKFTPNAFFTELFESKNENDRKYILWVSVADYNLQINFSDRVSLLTDYNDMVKVIPPAGPYPNMTNRFIEHPQSENVAGVEKYFGFIEDDILSRLFFKVNTIEDILLRNMIFGYEVVNQNTGASFILEEIPVNLSVFPKDSNDIQQIDYDNIRGFKLESGNNKNWVKIFRDEDNDTGTEKGYKVFFATKIRWEDWLQRDAVPTEYYDNTLLNDGYHNDWLDYLRSGNIDDYKINFFVFTEIIEDGEFKRHKNTFELTFNDYDENLNIETDHHYYRDSDDTLLNVGTDPETGKPLGVLLDNEPTRIEITYTHLFEDFDINKMYAVTTLEIDKGAGEFEHRQLSSVWGSEPDNPLIPLSGETHLRFEQLASNIVKATCLVNPDRLENALRYKITGRIGCWAEGTGGNNPKDGKYETKYEAKYE
ncbi:hypothetical protein PL373_13650 [Tenacibaculum maritimum]|nr:hypothetical protein [Tenacibaculum maritimum]MDB0602174.1 hypothetical protein [Tenacibaculum maritimum]MDB0613850.1 hypothetical protein [Tenacibaculum maritimum]